ncbi:hypothetical protein [Lysinibacillus piscis]|uniref:Uncharacterized protein n=1 Tax=Lysinibacillus piscis TaxID=2518931 RepID=A0ABQ5NK49_9BACI|nr:hypothetical protein [Lysinibacillus sp. KH24]GLC88664.1 hypothetical protein LYSBPC_17910 [Lysinibacillus sp. KH24]
MKLVLALEKMAKLPQILAEYGIPHKDVINVSYSWNATDVDVLVSLYSRESIEKIGMSELAPYISYTGEPANYRKITKYGITFVNFGMAVTEQCHMSKIQ